MNVRFAHPLSSDTFEADVDAACTGSLALRGLIDAKFLEPPSRGSYDLVVARTQATIAPNATFGSVGVREQELIQLFRRGAGA